MRRFERPGSAHAVAALAFVLCMGVVGGVAAPVAEARVQQAPSSRVALDLPDGFTPSPLFSGFVNEATGTSFIVVELPAAAYEQLAKEMTAEALAAKGIKNAQAAKLAREGHFVHMRGEQKAADDEFAKFLVVFRESGVTALVTANVPKAAIASGDVTAAEVEAVLASARVAPVAAPARRVFSLDYLGPFKAAGTLLGTTQVFTLDGELEPPDKGRARPTLIVAPSLDRRPVRAIDTYAETLLAGLPGMVAPKIEERNRLQIAGLEAIEIVGTATDKDTNAEVSVYQVVLLPASGGHYRIVGQLPLAERERLLPELRKIARQFRPLE